MPVRGHAGFAGVAVLQRGADKRRLMVRAPDFAEVFVGWRAWQVYRDGGGLRLRSAVFDEVWEPGNELRARCMRRPHHAPLKKCACGIYAVRDPREAVRYLIGRDEAGVFHRVIGLVALWGRVVEGPGGWRASRAYPVRIWVPPRRTNGMDAFALEVVVGLDDYGIPVELMDGHEPADVARELEAPALAS